MAALLVLALILAAWPAAAWPAPAAAGHGGAHDASADCGQHGANAVPGSPDREPGRNDHAPPGLACCPALHCPMLLASLTAAQPLPVPPAGRTDDAAGPLRQPAGLDIAPARKPPRDAA